MCIYNVRIWRFLLHSSSCLMNEWTNQLINEQRIYLQWLTVKNLSPEKWTSYTFWSHNYDGIFKYYFRNSCFHFIYVINQSRYPVKRRIFVSLIVNWVSIFEFKVDQQVRPLHCVTGAWGAHWAQIKKDNNDNNTDHNPSIRLLGSKPYSKEFHSC